ncbi:MAG: V/A-type H+-transporting ATPase subunit I [Candidatus Nanohaloarchaea archaeon]|jgi:V/A-type H+-transporting ATPase subunit I
MSKVSVTGPKKDMRNTIEELHDAGVMDINDYDGELETGNPFEEGDELSELLVDIRSILSKLPEKDSEIETTIPLEDLDEKVAEISEKIEELKERKESLKSEKGKTEDTLEFFRKLQGIKLDYSDLDGTESLGTLVTDVSEDKLDQELNGERTEFYKGGKLNVVVYDRRDTEEVEAALRRTGNEVYTVPEVKSDGSIENIVSNLEHELKELQEEKKNIESDIENLSENYYSKLQNTEEYLTEKVEKAEAPLSFATTDHAFIVKGWVPTSNYSDLSHRLDKLSSGRIHIQEEEQKDDEPPVKHKNNKAVQPFESLTDLVSRPRYNELDPSFVLLLTFPLFFGFMIGDAGYGLTSLAVFYGGYKMFPGASEIFKSLMYASVATLLFGLAFGDAFGFVIFGSHSELAAATGIQLFEKIPILWHRAEHLTQVFYISAVIGLVHVNAGYLLGAYNEFINHGVVSAVLEKGSWMLLQVGALLALTTSMNVGLGVMALAFAMLLKGEGVEGVVEIPSLLSNILSYLRIFGVSVAAVSLAQVVNAMANPLLVSGSAVGLVAGVGLLMFGHIFNTFIKILEGFLQGIRLHYVEMFDKFYHGGGRKYMPFGGDT